MEPRTRRQRLVEMLLEGEWTFDELRRELGVPVQVLSEDLRHVEKSARHLEPGPHALRITPARCRACGFVFTKRKAGRFTSPGRCPRCRNERIEPERMELG